MLTLFRRHTKDCKFTGRKHRNCQCPLAVEGTLHGRMIRKSLDLRSWEAAQKLVRDWEANPEGGGITVKIAVNRYISGLRGQEHIGFTDAEDQACLRRTHKDLR
jgi:hypothetical protein